MEFKSIKNFTAGHGNLSGPWQRAFQVGDCPSQDQTFASWQSLHVCFIPEKRINMHHATCCFGTRTKIVTQPKYVHQGCANGFFLEGMKKVCDMHRKRTSPSTKNINKKIHLKSEGPNKKNPCFSSFSGGFLLPRTK